MVSGPSRRLLVRIAALFTSLIVVSSILTGCLPASKTSATTAAVEASDNGFSIAVRGVEVQVPAGATDAGTNVTLDTIEAPIPDDVSTFASPIGTSVAMSLEGKQPQQPLTATFDVPNDVDPGTVFVLGEDSSTGSGVAFIESTFDNSRSTVTATIDHLSWFTPVVLEEESLTSQVRDWINESLGTSSATPECFGAENELEFTAVPDNVVWPCANPSGSGTEWSLQSNSGLVWQVLTKPTSSYEPLTSLSLSGLATAALYNSIKGSLKGDTVMLPLETLEAKFTATPPYEIALKVEPGLSQVATIMWGLSMILPSKWMDVASSGECLANIVQAATSSISGETMRTVFECIGSVLEGTGGDILGIMLTGPGLLATQLEGIGREIMQTNAVQFELDYRNNDRVGKLPGAAAWLYDLPNNLKSADQLHSDLPVLIGDDPVTFSNSTQLITRCYPANTSQSFSNWDNWTRMSFAIALTDQVPKDASITVSIGMATEAGSVPNATMSWTLKPGESIPRQELDITGVRSVWVFVEPSMPIPCGNDIFAVEVAQLLDAYME